MRQASFFCPQCQQQKLFQASEMSHTPHILASVFLCGLWLPIWLLIALSYREVWHCSFCGYHDGVAYLANPNLRAMENQRAEERERIREQTRISREGSTLQEYFAYFVSDNRGWLIGLGILFAFAGFAIFGISMATQFSDQSVAVKATPRPAPTTSEADQLAQSNRVEFARKSQENYRKGYPGISFEATGPRNDVLTIRHKLAAGDEFSRHFTVDVKKQIRSLGFSNIVLTNGKGEVQITP